MALITQNQQNAILQAFGLDTNRGAHLLQKSGSRSRTPSRTRSSRSSSRTRAKSKNTTRRVQRSRSASTKSGVRFAKIQPPKPHILKRIAPLLAQISMTKKKVSLVKSDYFAKDNKDVKNTDVAVLEQQLDMLNKEFDLLRETFRAGLKDRPIRMRLSAILELTATVTSGVVNTVSVGGSSALNPSVCTEWATMVALFDEYKCLGGEAVFNYQNGSAPVVATGLVTNNMPVMAYDVDNVAAAASVISLTQTSQHKILNSVTSVPNGAGTSGIYTGIGLKQTFRWHVPRGTEIGSAGSTMAGTEWIASANPVGAGNLLFYHVGTIITAINVGAGVVYFDLEFRCRV